MSGVNLVNGRERRAGEEWVTKIDGWSDIEIQGERYGMQRHRGKCKARGKVLKESGARKSQLAVTDVPE